MRTPDWQTADGSIRLFLGDCLDILPTLEAGSVDAVVTDPPYGIALDTNYSRFGDSVVHGRDYATVAGDSKPSSMAHLFSIGKKQVVFGANNWPQQIPFNPKRDGWICWDKRTNEAADEILGSPFELAVVIGQRCYDIIRLQHCGVKHADGDRAGRFHPTQKPVRLMVEVLDRISGETICDPYFGSGTTALACVRMGRSFIGCEIDPVHFATAVRRIEAELNRHPLLEPAPVIQRTMEAVA